MLRKDTKIWINKHFWQTYKILSTISNTLLSIMSLILFFYVKKNRGKKNMMLKMINPLSEKRYQRYHKHTLTSLVQSLSALIAVLAMNQSPLQHSWLQRKHACRRHKLYHFRFLRFNFCSFFRFFSSRFPPSIFFFHLTLIAENFGVPNSALLWSVAVNQCPSWKFTSTLTFMYCEMRK